MKRILSYCAMLVTAILCIFSLSACNLAGERMTYGDDLIYCYIPRSGHGRAEQSGDYIAVLELTEKGKQKDTIVIPDYIDGKPVVQLGMQGLGYLDKLSYDSSYTSIYLPKFLTNDTQNNYYISKLDRECKYYFIDLDNIDYILDSINRYGNDYHVSQKLYNKICENEVTDKVQSHLIIANVEFVCEEETYFIADYEVDSKITYIPDVPTQDGYEFDGWYREPNCVTEWNFDTDTFALAENETILKLYAKWNQAKN